MRNLNISALASIKIETVAEFVGEQYHFAIVSYRTFFKMPVMYVRNSLHDILLCHVKLFVMYGKNWSSSYLHSYFKMGQERNIRSER